MKSYLHGALLACAIVFAVAGAADAAGGVGHVEGPPTAEQWLLLLFTCINFAIFAYLLRRFTGAPLRDFLRGRRKEILDLMAEAAREKADAAALKSEYETKLARLESAKEDLIADVRRIAENDAEKLIAAASEAAARLKRDAERAAQSDHDRVIRELRAEAARLAAALAAEDIRRRADPSVRQQLVDDFLEGVAKI